MKQQEKIIPNGMRAASFTLEGNKMTIFFEPEKYVPKVGDLVKITYDTGNEYFLEVARVHFRGQSPIIHSEDVVIGEDGKIFKAQIVSTFKSIEKLTPEEFQSEFENHGYVYDFKTHTAHKKRWRAEYGETYYFVSGAFEIEYNAESGHTIDDKRYKSGNYFETEEACQKYCDYMKECSLKYFEQ